MSCENCGCDDCLSVRAESEAQHALFRRVVKEVGYDGVVDIARGSQYEVDVYLELARRLGVPNVGRVTYSFLGPGIRATLHR